MKKTVIYISGLLLFILSLTACGKYNNNANSVSDKLKITISETRELEVSAADGFILIDCYDADHELRETDRYNLETGLWDEYDPEDPNAKLVNEYDSIYYRNPSNEQTADPDYYYLKIVPDSDFPRDSLEEGMKEVGNISIEKETYHIITWESDEESSSSLYVF
ncbi:MAG: hypothetical protein PUB22_02880 [Clostridiales bacterium]|nr:hypothetical protein [Clostridiales bacterium]